MSRRAEWVELLLPLTALLPAVAIARMWPETALRDLPALTLPLYAAYRLGLALRLGRPRAFLLGAVAASLAWVTAAAVQRSAITPALILAGSLLGGTAWAAGRTRGGVDRACAEALRTALLGAAALVLGALFVSSRPAAPVPCAPAPVSPASRPALFIPIDVDPTGHRVVVFSLRDIDEPDDTAFTLWTIGAHDGQLARTYSGFPLFLTDWAPAGGHLAFLASDRSWEEEAVPFGVKAARHDGQELRTLLPPPVDGKTWLYPLWSKVDDWVGAWLVPATEVGGARVAAPTDLPRSFAVPVKGEGPARELAVRGCRLALLGAWQADQAGAFMMTERGLFRLGLDGKANRLVPSGETPMDPFPFIIPGGVSPSGQHLAYLELIFKKGEIDQFDLGLVDLSGRRRRVVRDLYPIAFGWSRGDGQRLGAITVDKRDQVRVVIMDAASGKQRWLETGLKLASRDFPMRLQFSRDGRYVAIDGQIADEESWDVAVLDLQTGKTTTLTAAKNHLVIGWRDDDKLIVGTLSALAAINPDGSGLKPIYGTHSAAPSSGHELGSAVTSIANARLRGLDVVTAAWKQLHPDWMR